MIEEVRRIYREKPQDFEWNLRSKEDAHVYRRFALEIHQTLMKTRKVLQAFLDTVDGLSSPNGRRASEKQISDLILFFVGIQKTTTNLVKGDFLLSQNMALPRPTAASILQTTDAVMEEGKRLVAFCESKEIPCFDPDFLQKILMTIGFEGFKKMVEEEEANKPPSKKVGRPLKKRAESGAI